MLLPFPHNLPARRLTAWLTMLAWVMIVVIAVIASPSLSDVTTSQQEEFLPVGVESVQALQLEKGKYPSGSGIPAITVFHSPDGLDESELIQIRAYSEFLESDEAPESVTGVISPFNLPDSAAFLQSPDGTTLTILSTIIGLPTSESFQETVDALSKNARTYGGYVSVDAAVTGPASILTDAIRVFQSIDRQVTLATVILVLVILFVIYRSPGLVFVPLIIIGSALILAQSLAALLAEHFSLAVNGQVTSIMSVLLFGAGTDYVLFIISRYREELRLHSDRFAAMSATMKHIGPSIGGSAGTTIVAMLILIFSVSGSFKTMGPMLALAVGVVLLAGLTALPTTLVLMGKWAFWPFVSGYAASGPAPTKGVWYSIGRIVSARPKLIFCVTTSLLVLAIIPAYTLIPSFNFIDGYPDNAESKIGYNLLKSGFPAGELAPTTIFVTTEYGNISDKYPLIESLAASLEQVNGISRVSGVTRPNGLPVDLDVVYESEISRYNSPDLSTTRLDVVLDGDPYSKISINTIDDIRSAAATILREHRSPEIRVLVGGESAIQFDNKQAIDRDMKVLAPTILLAILIILIIIQRAIVAPLYMLFSILISYAATYGLSIGIFQFILGHSGVAYSNGIWIFVFLVALGADYNIFVIARIREEIQSRGLKRGVATAVGRTGGVVTSAGIILAGTFSVLTTLPLRDIYQLGFAIALGVLIDTFIVRALLVPSMATICGQYNFWPFDKDK